MDSNVAITVTVTGPKPDPLKAGVAIRVPNTFCPPRLRSSANDDEWWRQRSGAIKAIMLFQCLLHNYVWDEDVQPALNISQLIVMVDHHTRNNRAWMNGINNKYLKHPVTGNVRPIDVVMRLLGLWTFTGRRDGPEASQSQSQAWPVAMMFADPVKNPLFHIRPRDGSAAGLEALATWRPHIYDPTFVRQPFAHDAIYIPTIFHGEKHTMKVSLGLWTHDNWRSSPHETARFKAIEADLWRLHNHDYGGPPAGETQSFIPSTRSSSTTTISISTSSRSSTTTCVNVQPTSRSTNTPPNSSPTSAKRRMSTSEPMRPRTPVATQDPAYTTPITKKTKHTHQRTPFGRSAPHSPSGSLSPPSPPPGPLPSRSRASLSSWRSRDTSWGHDRAGQPLPRFGRPSFPSVPAVSTRTYAGHVFGSGVSGGRGSSGPNSTFGSIAASVSSPTSSIQRDESCNNAPTLTRASTPLSVQPYMPGSPDRGHDDDMLTLDTDLEQPHQSEPDPEPAPEPAANRDSLIDVSMCGDDQSRSQASENSVTSKLTPPVPAPSPAPVHVPRVGGKTTITITTTTSTSPISRSTSGLEPELMLIVELESKTDNMIVSVSPPDMAAASAFVVLLACLRKTDGRHSIPTQVMTRELPPPSLGMGDARLAMPMSASVTDVLRLWDARLLLPNKQLEMFCLNHPKLKREHQWLRAFLLTWFPPVETRPDPGLAAHQSPMAIASLIPQFLDFHANTSQVNDPKRLSVICLVCHHLAGAVVDQSDAQVAKRLGSGPCLTWWKNMTQDNKAATSIDMAHRRINLSVLQGAVPNTLQGTNAKVLAADQIINHGRSVQHRVAILYASRCGAPSPSPPSATASSLYSFTPLLVTSPRKGLLVRASSNKLQLVPLSKPYEVQQQFLWIKTPRQQQPNARDDGASTSIQTTTGSDMDTRQQDKENVNPNVRTPTPVPTPTPTPTPSRVHMELLGSKSVFDWDELPDDVRKDLSSSSSESNRSSTPVNESGSGLGPVSTPCMGLYHAVYHPLIRWNGTSRLNVVNRDEHTTWLTNRRFRECPFMADPDSLKLMPDGHNCKQLDFHEWREVHVKQYHILRDYCAKNPLAHVEPLDPPWSPTPEEVYPFTIRAHDCHRYNNSKQTVKGFEFTCTNCRSLKGNLKRKLKRLAQHAQAAASNTQQDPKKLVESILRSISEPVLRIAGATTTQRQHALALAVGCRVPASSHPLYNPSALAKANRDLRQSNETMFHALRGVNRRFSAVQAVGNGNGPSDHIVTPAQQQRYLHEILSAVMGTRDGAHDMAKLHKCLAHISGDINKANNNTNPSSVAELNAAARFTLQVNVVRELIDRLAAPSTRGKSPSEVLFSLATILRLQLGFSMYNHIHHILKLPSVATLDQPLSTATAASPDQAAVASAIVRSRLYDIARIGANPFRVQQAVMECRMHNGNVNEPWVLASDAGRCTRRIDALVMDTDDVLSDNLSATRLKQLVLIGMTHPSYIPLDDLIRSPQTFITIDRDDRDSGTLSFTDMTGGEIVLHYIRHVRKQKLYAGEYDIMCLSSAMSVHRGATVASVEPHDRSITAPQFAAKIIDMLKHCFLSPTTLRAHRDMIMNKSRPISMSYSYVYRPADEIAHVMGTSHDNAACQQSALLHLQSPRSRVVQGLVAAQVVFCARMWPGIKLMSPYLVPHCPLILNTDYEHVVRLIIKGLRRPDAHEFTFGVTTDSQSNKLTITASMTHFVTLGNKIRGKSNIHDHDYDPTITDDDRKITSYSDVDCRVQSVHDQRPDSAARFLSIRLTELLVRHVGPASYGTCVYIRMMTYLTEPYHGEEYTGNPELIQQVVTKGITMLRLWHHWLVHIAKLGPVHAGRPDTPARFVNRSVFQACELLFHSATHWCLAYHRHFRHIDGAMSRLCLRRLSSRHCEQLICTLQGKGTVAPTNDPRPCIRDIIFNSSRIQKLHSAFASLTRHGAPTFTSKRSAQVDARIARTQSKVVEQADGPQCTPLDRSQQLAQMSEQEYDAVMHRAYMRGQSDAVTDLSRFVPDMMNNLRAHDVTDLNSLCSAASSHDRVFVASLKDDPCSVAVVSIQPAADPEEPYDSQRLVTSALPPAADYCKLYQVEALSADTWVFASNTGKAPQHRKQAALGTTSHLQPDTAVVSDAATDTESSCTATETEASDSTTTPAQENATPPPGSNSGLSLSTCTPSRVERVGVIFPVPVNTSLQPSSHGARVRAALSPLEQYESTGDAGQSGHDKAVEQDLFETDTDVINAPMIKAELDSLHSQGAITHSIDTCTPPQPSKYNILVDRKTAQYVHIRKLLNECQEQEWVSRDRAREFIMANDLPGDVPIPKDKYIRVGMDVMIWQNMQQRKFQFARIAELKNTAATSGKNNNKVKHELFAPWKSGTHKFKVEYFTVIPSVIADPPNSCRMHFTHTTSRHKSPWMNMNRLINIVNLTPIRPTQSMSQDSKSLMRWDDTAVPSWCTANPHMSLHGTSNITTHLYTAAPTASNETPTHMFVSPAPRVPSKSRRKADTGNEMTAAMNIPIPHLAPLSNKSVYNGSDIDLGSGSDSSVGGHGSAADGTGTGPVPQLNVTIKSSSITRSTQEETLTLELSDGTVTDIPKPDFIIQYGASGQRAYTMYKKQRRDKKRKQDLQQQADEYEQSLSEASNSESDSRTPAKRPRRGHCNIKLQPSQHTVTLSVKPEATTEPAGLPPTSSIPAQFVRDAAIYVCPVQRRNLIDHARRYVIPSTVCDLTSQSNTCFYASIAHQFMKVEMHMTEEDIVREAKKIKHHILDELRTKSEKVLAVLTPSFIESVPLTDEQQNGILRQFHALLTNHTPRDHSSSEYYKHVADAWWHAVKMGRQQAFIDFCLYHYSGSMAAADTYILPLVANCYNVPICVLQHTQHPKTATSNTTTVSSSNGLESDHSIFVSFWAWPACVRSISTSKEPADAPKPKGTTATSKSRLKLSAQYKNRAHVSAGSSTLHPKRPSSSQPTVEEAFQRQKSKHCALAFANMYSHAAVISYQISGHYMSMMDINIPMDHGNRRQSMWDKTAKDKQAEYQQKVYLCHPVTALMASPTLETIQCPNMPQVDSPPHNALVEEALQNIIHGSNASASVPVPIKSVDEWVTWFAQHSPTFPISRWALQQIVTRQVLGSTYTIWARIRQERQVWARGLAEENKQQRSTRSTCAERKQQGGLSIAEDPLYQAMKTDQKVNLAIDQLCTESTLTQWQNEGRKVGSEEDPFTLPSTPLPVPRSNVQLINQLNINIGSKQLTDKETALLRQLEHQLDHFCSTNAVEYYSDSETLWAPLLHDTRKYIVDEAIEVRLQMLMNHHWLHDEQPPVPGCPKRHILITSVKFPVKLYTYKTNTYSYGEDVIRFRHCPAKIPVNIHDGFRLVVIPYHHGGNHWVLFTIDFIARRIECFDSLPNPCMPDRLINSPSSVSDQQQRWRLISPENWMFMHALAMFINDEWKVQQASLNRPVHEYINGYGFDGWHTYVHTQCPQQQELPLTNCGLHMMLNAQAVVVYHHNTRISEYCHPRIPIHNKNHPSQLLHMASVPPLILPNYHKDVWTNIVRRRMAIEMAANCLYDV